LGRVRRHSTCGGGMTGEEVVTLTWNSCEAFGKCGKFAGAATVEIIKKALANEALPASVRDVFIQGLPVEWDLVVPRPSAQPSLNGLLYEPGDVACALESNCRDCMEKRTRRGSPTTLRGRKPSVFPAPMYTRGAKELPCTKPPRRISTFQSARSHGTPPML
jgi:hypothetical protein